MNKKVLFIDSGIGGLTTLANCLKLCPTLSFVYVADTIHAPYGTKTKSQIIFYLENIIETEIKTNNIGIVVLACNTATATAINHLRIKYPFLTFLGTEPAILPAIKQNPQDKKVLVMATPLTLAQTKFKNLIKPYKQSLILCQSKTLASLIENYFLNKTNKNLLKIKDEITRCYATHSANISGVVLGCTHYSLVAPVFAKIFGAQIFDGNTGVAKRLFKVVSTSPENYYCPTKVFPTLKQTAPTKTNYHKILNELLKK